MEVNLKGPIHIEFYGIPGCGKSTISHMVAERLRELGFKVYEPSYDSDHNLQPVFRKISKMFTTIFFCLSNHKEYKELQRLAKENGYINFSASIKQIVNIVPKIKCYRKRESAVYLWDEGLVQSAISLALNSKADIRKTEKDLFVIVGKKNTIKVYLKIDIETALQRMEDRNSNDSRVEQESDKNKKRLMTARFEERCNRVSNGIVQIECSELSAEMICNSIANRLSELI